MIKLNPKNGTGSIGFSILKWPSLVGLLKVKAVCLRFGHLTIIAIYNFWLACKPLNKEWLLNEADLSL